MLALIVVHLWTELCCSQFSTHVRARPRLGSRVMKYATCEHFRCGALEATMDAWFASCVSDADCQAPSPSDNDRLIMFKNENGLQEYRGPEAPRACCDVLVRMRMRECVMSWQICVWCAL